MVKVVSSGKLHIENGSITLIGWRFDDAESAAIHIQPPLNILDAALDHIREAAVRAAIASGEITASPPETPAVQQSPEGNPPQA
jgi:hypothetical protein